MMSSPLLSEESTGSVVTGTAVWRSSPSPIAMRLGEYRFSARDAVVDDEKRSCAVRRRPAARKSDFQRECYIEFYEFSRHGMGFSLGLGDSPDARNPFIRNFPPGAARRVNLPLDFGEVRGVRRKVHGAPHGGEERRGLARRAGRPLIGVESSSAGSLSHRHLHLAYPSFTRGVRVR